MKEKISIAEVRKALKGTGVTIAVHSFSWGPHARIKIDGEESRSVMTVEQYAEQSKRLAPLAEIVKGKTVVNSYGEFIYGFGDLVSRKEDNNENEN